MTSRCRWKVQAKANFKALSLGLVEWSCNSINLTTSRLSRWKPVVYADTSLALAIAKWRQSDLGKSRSTSAAAVYRILFVLNTATSQLRIATHSDGATVKFWVFRFEDHREPLFAILRDKMNCTVYRDLETVFPESPWCASPAALCHAAKAKKGIHKKQPWKLTV